jgi:hypothetical protein
MAILDDVDGPASTASKCQSMVAGAPKEGGRPIRGAWQNRGRSGQERFSCACGGERGRVVTRKKSRLGMRKFFSSIEPCLARRRSGSAHYWGRELKGMGHDVRLAPPIS